MELTGKTALVTGASAGIGRASAIALTRAGAQVIATGRRAAELQSLKKQTGARTLVGDLNDKAFAQELASAAREADLFVNNAGILKYAPFLEMTDEDCEAMFRTNVLAAFRISRLVAQSMVARARPHHRHDLDRRARGLSARPHLLRDQARAFRDGAWPAPRAAVAGHQGDRDRARHGRHRHPGDERPSARAGSIQGAQVLAAQLGGCGR